MRPTLSGASRAAIGATLLRSPGSNSPLQYDFSGSIRSACPAAFARPSIYAAKRLSCGPGAEGLVPTKQFYTKVFFYNTVVLRDITMATCYRCGADTQAYGNTLPMCVRCS